MVRASRSKRGSKFAFKILIATVRPNLVSPKFTFGIGHQSRSRKAESRA